MKKQVVIQNVMILIPVCLLLLGFFCGTMTMTAQTTEYQMAYWEELPDGTRPGVALGLLGLSACIGAIAFRITGKKKPLDWVVLGSGCGAVLYWLLPLRYTQVYVRFHIVVFVFLSMELLLAIIYKIGQRLSIFV